jgi:glycosyltransferase involved in cell wall biosynthesis
MKNLLLVTNNLYQPRGGEIWALKLSEALKDRFSTKILFPNPAATSKGANEMSMMRGVCYIEVRGKLFRSRVAGTQYDFFMPSLSGLLRISSSVSKADVVYCISSNPLMISVIIMLSKLYKKRIIYGIHNPLFSTIAEGKDISTLARFISKAMLAKVDAFHALNLYDYRIALRKFPKVKAYLIPNFLPKTVSAKAITVNRKRFTVLFVGKLLKREKGIDFLSEIIKLVLNKNEDIHFRIIGSDGDSEELLKSLEERYPKNVEVLGFIDKNRLARQYASADLFVLTSRKETFGLALLEAQSHGIPAVSFDSGGPTDIVIEGFQGRIIKKFDTEGFAAAVLEYYKKWQDKERYLRLKREINKEINTRYGRGRIIPKLFHLLIED